MLTKKIFSLQHSLIKHWVSLRTDRAYREQKKRVLILGEKLVRELSRTFPLQSLIAVDPDPQIHASEVFAVSEPVLKKITGLQQPDGYAAEIFLPPPQDLTLKKRVLILDQIQDPGNLGTLLRTALALDWEGVIFTPGTVDLFNDKALRAAKGATFHLPYAKLSSPEILSWIEKKKIQTYTADLEGTLLSEISVPSSPVALILSHEGQGPGSWSRHLSQKITIPMAKQVESLNVATSGAILLYALRGLV